MAQYYLILDTSNKSLAVGIANDQEVISKTQYEAWQKQSELTISEIQKILEKTKIEIDQVTKIIVTQGPGSYTGVRIALTIAKVLALAKQIPLVIISSLLALAGKQPKVMSIIDARSARCYVGRYDLGVALATDTIMTIEEIKHLSKEYKIVGEVSVLGLEEKEIDIIENMFQVGKDLPAVKNLHAVKPTYLKD